MAEYEKLKKFEFFKKFSSGEIIEFSKKMDEYKYENNQDILNDETINTDMYFIISGKVSIYKAVPEGVKIFTYLEPTDVFGEVAFIDKMERSASAAAVGEVIVYRLAFEKFVELQNENPLLASKFLIEVMRELTRKFRSINEGLDIKSAEYTVHEIIKAGKEVKVSTISGADYICKIKHADLEKSSPIVKIDIKGQMVLIPFHQVKSISLPNKFGKY